MASQRQTSSSSFLFSPFMTPLASAHNFAHMQETGFGNLVICRGNRQMLYPSLCVFTFQIPPCAAVASSATYQKTVTRPICPGLKSEIHYTYRRNSPTGPLLHFCDRREEIIAPQGGYFYLRLKWSIQRPSQHLLTWHSTVQAGKLRNMAIF